MAADKKAKPINQSEGSNMFISCTLHSLALRLECMNEHT
jgi:hypothetical protein